MQAVKKLNEYWAAKTLFLKVRKDPSIVNDPNYQEKALSFLNNSSNLKDYPFWQNLTEEQKRNATKFLTLQEVDSKTIRLDADHNNAQIFIVLNGTVDVKYSHLPDSIICGAGDIFGSRQLFNRTSHLHGAKRNIYYDESADSDPMEENATIVASAGKFATLIKISFDDYSKNVLQCTNVSEEEELEKERREDELIAEIPFDKLTAEDKVFIKVYKVARRVMANDIFGFLDTYKFIPRNARTNAQYNYNVGSIGREIILNKNEFANTVIFVIDGSIRLDIIATNRKSKSSTPSSLPSTSNKIHTVSCNRKGSEPMVMQVSSIFVLPSKNSYSLLRLENVHAVNAARHWQHSPHRLRILRCRAAVPHAPEAPR